MKLGLKIGLLLGLLFLLLLGLDFALKKWVWNSLFEPIALVSTPFGINFSLHCVTNLGGAWGLLSSYHYPLLIFRIIIIACIFGYLSFFATSRKLALALTFILAGAMGNVMDSFIYGQVIDMLHFTFWEKSYGIFNLADTWIFLGTLGLIMQKSFSKKQTPKDTSYGS